MNAVTSWYNLGYTPPFFGVGSLIEKSGIMTAKSWQELYQRGLAEMFETDFCAAWMLSLNSLGI
jgi:hypothetical protein